LLGGVRPIDSFWPRTTADIGRLSIIDGPGLRVRPSFFGRSSLPLAYHGTTIEITAFRARIEGLKKPAPVFTGDRKRASRGAEALSALLAGCGLPFTLAKPGGFSG